MDSIKVLLSKPSNDTVRVRSLNWLSWLYCTRCSYDSAIISADSALSISERMPYTKGIIAASLNIGLVYHYKNDYATSLKYYLTALHYADSINFEAGLASLNNNIGNVLMDQGNYPEGLKYLLSSLKLYDSLKDKEGMASTYGNIGLIYEKLKNYSAAIDNYTTAIKMAKEIKDTQLICYCFNYSVSVYIEQGDYKRAGEAGNEALLLCQKAGNAELVSDAEYHIGQLSFRLGKLDDALSYLNKTLEIKEKIGDKKLVSKLENEIGRVLVEMKNYPEAEEHFQKALMIAYSIGAKENIDAIYWSLTKLDSAKGDYKSGYYNFRNYLIYKDSIYNEQVSAKIVTEQLTYDFDKKQTQEKAEVEKKEAHQLIIRNIIFVCFLIAILFAFVFFRQRRRIARELFLAKANLQEYVKNMAEKSTMLLDFQEEINKLKSSTDEQRVSKLQTLNQAIILTDADWNQFRILFEQVYPGFLSRLKVKLPDLTPGEIRLVSLTKLNIGTKQMAGILGVSDDTIRKTRYRLRKKLGLAEENTLDDVVNSI